MNINPILKNAMVKILISALNKRFIFITYHSLSRVTTVRFLVHTLGKYSNLHYIQYS